MATRGKDNARPISLAQTNLNNKANEYPIEWLMMQTVAVTPDITWRKQSAILENALPEVHAVEEFDWCQPLLLCTAAAKGDIDKVREYVEKGYDPKGHDYDGRTPLHLACEEGHMEVVMYLVSIGADINCQDRWGTTPIRGALTFHHRHIFSYLKERGAVMGFSNKLVPGDAELKVAEKTEELQSMFSALNPAANKSMSKLTIPAKMISQYLKEQGIYPKKHKVVGQKLSEITSSAGEVSFAAYQKLVNETDSTLARAFKGNLVIPNWKSFVKDVTDIFEECRSYNEGKRADYIPELAEVDPNTWSLSITTVDGQTLSLGDTDVDFSMQSCGKPLLYSFCAESVGVAKIHEYVGREPSGVAFNAFTLNAQKKPHNPFINAGAILTSALFHPELVLAKKFKKLTENLNNIAGGERIGFNQSVYLSEKSVAHRNYALAHFMESEGGFPPQADLMDTVDFYFQMCSCEANTAGMASIAATFANNGKSPLTHKKILSSSIVKSTLQLMYSCGMYDFSGEWACTAGIPAKSGVSGCIFAVIPGVMGISVYSPNLDNHGNSIRGMEFVRRLVEKFGWNLFDILYADRE